MRKFFFTTSLLLLFVMTACKRNVATSEIQKEEKDYCLADSIILVKEEPVYDVVDKLHPFRTERRH